MESGLLLFIKMIDLTGKAGLRNYRFPKKQAKRPKAPKKNDRDINPQFLPKNDFDSCAIPVVKENLRKREQAKKRKQHKKEHEEYLTKNSLLGQASPLYIDAIPILQKRIFKPLEYGSGGEEDKPKEHKSNRNNVSIQRINTEKLLSEDARLKQPKNITSNSEESSTNKKINSDTRMTPLDKENLLASKKTCLDEIIESLSKTEHRLDLGDLEAEIKHSSKNIRPVKLLKM